LSATGEATDAEKLVPIHWAHVSGVNYKTIGDAGEEFLATLSKSAKFKVRTTVNPMGYDKDSVEKFGLDEILYKNRKASEHHTKRWEQFQHFLVFLMSYMICHRKAHK